MSRFNRRSLAASAALAWALASAPAAYAQATYSFDLPAQELGRSLQMVARQTGSNIVFEPAAVSGRTAPALSGSFSAEQAIERLLADSGLAVRRTSGGSWVVAAPSGEVEAGSAAADSGSAGDEAIVVTGSRLAQRGEGPTPVTAFNEDRIDQLGATSVAQVLDYLPQQTFSFSDSFNFAGSRSVQLRGLGLGTTLVLVNGRRTVTAAAQSARGFFDVNTIPLSAVERIEILSNSASAIYGADAVAGVVNIILKDEIERPTFDLYYGFTPEGGSDEFRASTTLGVTSGRFRSALTLDYFRRTPLFGAEREISASQDLRRFGGPDARTPNANPGNVSSTSAAPLPGLTSTFAAVPRGSSGVGLTPASFLATQGTRNLESTSRFGSLVGDAERMAVVGSAEFDLADWITLFGEFMYTGRRDVRTLSPPSLNNVLVPASNPFNPFGVPVRVNFLLTGIGVREDISNSDSTRIVLGGRGEIGSWNWELSGLLTQDNADNRLTNQTDAARVAAALASTNPATALNPFQDGPGGSPQVLRSILADIIASRFASSAKQLAGFVSGPLFELPGGSVELVVGGEARREDVRFDSPPAVPNLTVDRTALAAFGELRVPLIGREMDVPLVDRLTVTAAARYDDYSDFGGTFNPQLGVEWSVTPGLLLRASYGTSFRPPTLFELNQPRVVLTGAQTVIDPRRNNEVYVIDTLILGGNAALDPEEAKAFSAGFVVTPRWLNGFRFSVDYWRIEQDLRVQRFGPTDVLVNESVFPERVTRAPQTPQDVAAGRPGRIVSLDATNINFGGVTTDGFDFDASYRIETGIGTFQPSLRATYVDSFLEARLPNLPAVERAGVANFNGSIPRWRATGSLAWSRNGLQLSATGRYIGSYRDADFFGVQTGRRVESRLIVDAQVAYTFGEDGAVGHGLLNGLTLRAGAINLFDQEPAFASPAALFGTGYDQSLADVRQRFVYFALSKAF